MILLRAALAATVLVTSAASAQVRFNRYEAGGLSAELPGPGETSDNRVEGIKARVITLESTIEEPVAGKTWPEFRAYYMVQGVIADEPYDVDAKLKEMTEPREDAVISNRILSTRTLSPSEMPVPGMRGVERVMLLSGFGDGSEQIETSHDMFVGNRWLSVSVRHGTQDDRWSAEPLFRSLTWEN